MTKPLQLDGSRTLAQSAYRLIRSDILSGSIAPGDKLQIVELSQQHGTNASAIREALSRLVSESLVTVQEQKGFRAAPMSSREFSDITNLRIILEGEALRLATENGGEEWEAAIVAAYYRLALAEKRLATEGPEATPEWEARNCEFHDALVMACDSQWLMRLRKLLYDHSRRYRQRTLHAGALRQSSALEHQMLHDAVLARDTKRACALISQHFTTTFEAYRQFALSTASGDE